MSYFAPIEKYTRSNNSTINGINDWLGSNNYCQLNKEWIKLGDGGGDIWEKDHTKNKNDMMTFQQAFDMLKYHDTKTLKAVADNIVGGP